MAETATLTGYADAAAVISALDKAVSSLQPGDVAPIDVAVTAADKTALDLITDQADGAFGLALATATLYQWSNSGQEWVLVTPIRGETGPAGADGVDGADGADGGE